MSTRTDEIAAALPLQDSTVGATRKKYLFVRILEACNANCFMCGFARSKDRYRFSLDDLEALLPEALALGVGVVRFTGGEPLLHGQIVELVAAVDRAGLASSIITNGFMLPRLGRELATAGLTQIIVSIDGATAATHDAYRDTPDLFARGIEGLQLLGALGIRTRVNTVVGPHNYGEMLELQALLARLGVHSWELSALKLHDQERYIDRADVLRVGAEIYAGSLRPLGKPWYGETPEEQDRYFDGNIPPQASHPTCHVVDDVIYVDGRNGGVFPCSCLPHRDDVDEGLVQISLAPTRTGSLRTPGYLALQATYRVDGPVRCSGCSATAAGYSDEVERSGRVDDWAY